MKITVEKDYSNIEIPMYVQITLKSGSRITQIVDQSELQKFFDDLYRAADNPKNVFICINDFLMFCRDDISFVQVTDRMGTAEVSSTGESIE